MLMLEQLKVYAVPNLAVDYIIAGRWKVTKFLGNGLFGSVYDVIDMQSENEEHYAAKVEYTESLPTLEGESHILKEMKNKDHICKLITSGNDGRINYMILTLTGKNLLQVQEEIPNYMFRKTDVFKIAVQCFEAIRELHEEQYVHCDIKPENFAVERNGTFDKLYLLDFGIARKLSPKDAKHNLRYGYKEDVMACFCMIISMYRGLLYANRYQIENEFKELSNGKRNMKSSKNNYPKEFLEVYNYLDGLLQTDMPDYSYLINTFNKMHLDAQQENHSEKLN